MLVISTVLKKQSAYRRPTDPTWWETLFNKLPDIFTTAVAVASGTGFHQSESTVKRLLLKWLKGGEIIKITKDNYQKIKR